MWKHIFSTLVMPWKIEDPWIRISGMINLAVFVYFVVSIFTDVPYFSGVVVIWWLVIIVVVIREMRDMHRFTKQRAHLDNNGFDFTALSPQQQENIQISRAKYKLAQENKDD